MDRIDQIARLVLEIEGGQGVVALTEQLNYNKGSIDQLKAAYERGDVAQEQFLKDGARLTVEQAKLQAIMDRVTQTQQAQAAAAGKAGASVDVAGNATASATEKMGAGAGNAAYKMQQLAGTLDDLQYVGEQGLRPVLNNIMQISPTVGIALLAFELVRKGIQTFAGEAAEAGNEIERLKKRVEDLENKPHKIVIDLDNLTAAEAKLTDMERRLSAFEANRQTAQEADLAKQASDVAKNYGGSDALAKAVMEGDTVWRGKPGDEQEHKDLKDLLKRQMQGAGDDPKKQAEITDWFARHHGKRFSEMEASVEEGRRKYAKDEVGAFNEGDPDAIRRMQNRARDFPGRFSTVGPRGIDAAEAITNLPATPAEAQERAERERGNQLREAQMKDQREAKAKADKDARDAAIKRGRDVIKAAQDEAKFARKDANADAKQAATEAKAAAKAEASAGATATPRGPRALPRPALPQGLEAALSAEAGSARPVTMSGQVGELAAARLQQFRGGQAKGRPWGDQDLDNPPENAGFKGGINADAAPAKGAWFVTEAEQRAKLAKIAESNLNLTGQLTGQQQAMGVAISAMNGKLGLLQTIVRNMNGRGGGSQLPFATSPVTPSTAP